jgi:PII-like signaling protein
VIQEVTTPEPGRILPEFPGQLVASWQALVPGLANKAEDVAKEFVERIKQRNLPGVTVREGMLGPLGQRRSYWLVEQILGVGAKATTAVQIVPFGQTDLRVEWRHFEQGLVAKAKRAGIRTAALFAGFIIGAAGLVTLIFGYGLILVIAGIALIIYGLTPRGERRELKGFQSQDSWALNQAVDLALREALELVDIGAESIREIPMG